jgi:hypothetical protein
MEITRNKPRTGWRPFIMLMYGMPKVGKSTVAADFSPDGIESSLLIDTENGTDEIDCNRIKVNSLNQLHKALNMAYKSDFRTIAIDTIDEVYRWVEADTVLSLNAKIKVSYSSVEEFGYGVGFAVARKTMLDIINRLHVFKAVNKTVLLVSHQKQATGDTDSEKSRTVDLPGKLSRMIAAAVDAIGLIYVTKDEKDQLHRWISFKPYEQIDAGCRLRELAGKDLLFSFDAIYKELTNNKGGARKNGKPISMAA